ncbi:MAG: hypothetical protein BWX83_01289 [Candidatus Cloacimonetes bacterium ADurb.Bin117]|nr:MAG: hypothetical protein BWX83_01289 [Candidatus Cloacimonetes bacterium ADurb.Bin117]
MDHAFPARYIQLVQKQHLYPGAGGFFPEEAGGNHLAGIQNQHLTGSEETQNIRKPAVDNVSRGPFHTHQAGTFPTRKGMLGNKLRRQFIVVAFDVKKVRHGLKVLVGDWIWLQLPVSGEAGRGAEAPPSITRFWPVRLSSSSLNSSSATRFSSCMETSFPVGLAARYAAK